ncbi:hypothetical protein B0H19DRAFT_1271508 [Mycena capillaripes]|nr:hypothetical protein B0H19DRAFT_1271508 [Mycena capillaripes]
MVRIGIRGAMHGTLLMNCASNAYSPSRVCRFVPSMATHRRPLLVRVWRAHGRLSSSRIPLKPHARRWPLFQDHFVTPTRGVSALFTLVADLITVAGYYVYPI